MPARIQRRHLVDAATLCAAVLPVPGEPLVCHLPAGHLANGRKHQSGCTRWGDPRSVTVHRPSTATA